MKVLSYLHYTLFRYRRKPNTKDDQLLHTSSYKSRQRIVLFPGFSRLRLAVFTFSYNRNVFLVRTVKINGSVQKFIPMFFTKTHFISPRYPSVSVEQGERCMCSSMRWRYYWPQMTNDIYMTKIDCLKCVQV